MPALCATALAPFPARMAQTSAAAAGRVSPHAISPRLARLFPGASHVTDKRPDNFLYLGLIKTPVPEREDRPHDARRARQLPVGLLSSISTTAMGYALDLMDTAHYYRQYRRLMAHWNSLYGADILDFDYDALRARAAARGREAARVLRARLGGRLHGVSPRAQRGQDGERVAGARAPLSALVRPLAQLRPSLGPLRA